MHGKSIATVLYMCYNANEVKNMENLPKCYTVLFNTLTEVIEAIDRMDFGTARALLIRGQQEAEEAYASEEEEENTQ